MNSRREITGGIGEAKPRDDSNLVQVFHCSSNLDDLKKQRPVVLISEVSPCGKGGNDSKPFQSLGELQTSLGKLLPSRESSSEGKEGTANDAVGSLEELQASNQPWKPTICVLLEPPNASGCKGDKPETPNMTEQELKSMQTLTQSHGVRFIQKGSGSNDGEILSLIQFQKFIQASISPFPFVQGGCTVACPPTANTPPATAKDRWDQYAQTSNYRGEASGIPDFPSDKQLWPQPDRIEHPLENLFEWYRTAEDDEPPEKLIS